MINDYSCLRKCWLSDIRLLDELNLAYCRPNSSEEQCRSLSCYLFFQNELYPFQISVCWLSFQRLRADLISPIHWLDHWEPIYHLIKCCVHQFRLKAENCCFRQDIVKELVWDICAALLLLNLLKNASCCSLLISEIALEAVHLIWYCSLQY